MRTPARPLTLVLPLWVACLALLPVPARAGLSTPVEVSGAVSDFDHRYVYLNSRTERYRIKRGAVPESVVLQPGVMVDFSVTLGDVLIVPQTAPLRPPANYHPPRRRVPADSE